jgi:hypothetical protein
VFPELSSRSNGGDAGHYGGRATGVHAEGEGLQLPPRAVQGDVVTVFIYAHCFYIWSLFLYMFTEFTYAQYFNICSLFLYMLTVFIYDHCFYICSLSLYMLTVFIYTH